MPISAPVSASAAGILSHHASRRAGVALVVAAVLFGLMAVGTKAVSQTLPGPQVALLRMLFGLCVFAVAAVRQPRVLRPNRPRWLAARGLFGGIAVLLYFVSIDKVGVGLATVIHYSAPVWAAMLGWLLLRERVSLLTLIALAAALTGVGLIMGPTLVLAWQQGASSRVAPGWYAMSLTSAVVSAGALVSIRASRRASAIATQGPAPEGEWTLFGGFSLFGAVAAGPFALPPLGRWVWPSGTVWLLMLGVGVVSVLAQLIMTRALAHVSAAAPGVANQLAVLIASAAGVLFFDERLSAVMVVGAVFVIAGVVLSVVAPPPPQAA